MPQQRRPPNIAKRSEPASLRTRTGMDEAPDPKTWGFATVREGEMSRGTIARADARTATVSVIPAARWVRLSGGEGVLFV